MNAAARIAFPESLDETSGKDSVVLGESREEAKDLMDAKETPMESRAAQEPSSTPEDGDDDIDGLSTLELGRKGEEAAARYLALRGYEILERNWTCRFGEADIIAWDPDGVLCFIEVKTRRGVNAGLPEEAITREKQARYERIALCFLMNFDEWEDNDPVRFDAIGICVSAPHRALLRHHRGCFNGCF